MQRRFRSPRCLAPTPLSIRIWARRCKATNDAEWLRWNRALCALMAHYSLLDRREMLGS